MQENLDSIKARWKFILAGYEEGLEDNYTKDGIQDVLALCQRIEKLQTELARLRAVLASHGIAVEP